MLYIFGGLPGTGKTELSRYLAQTIAGVYIRIDTIEQVLKNKGIDNLYDEGYQVAFSVALDNLKNGLPVIADSTNPVEESRLAWRAVAKDAKVQYKEIEIICSDKSEHRSRVEKRRSDIPKLTLPSWDSVIKREYEPWASSDILVDTAARTTEQSKMELLHLLNIPAYSNAY